MTSLPSKHSSAITDLTESAPAVYFLTGGDPAGLGPELIEVALRNLWQSQSGNSHIIYFATGNSAHLERIQKSCLENGVRQENVAPTLSECQQACSALTKDSLDSLDSLTLLLSDLTQLLPASQRDTAPGNPGVISGWLAWQALKLACEVAQVFRPAGMMTAPLSKEWVIRAGASGFCGHTSYLADHFDCSAMMLMHGEELSVIPLTEHLPLGEVPRALKKRLEGEEIEALLGGLRACQGYDAPWALCGLNPHAGEGGMIGLEEQQFLNGWAEGIRQQGFPLEGPFPADGLCMESNRSRYRLILGCYHDQVLIPFKMIEGMRGVNCTLGLPFLRTSPAHGTAYEIAGQGHFHAESGCRALKLLADREWGGIGAIGARDSRNKSAR